MGKITDEELEMLSDEEREALKEEDTRTPEEIAAAEAAAAEEKATADAEAKVAAEANMTEEEKAAKKAEDDLIEEEAKAKAKADADAAAKVQADKEAADLEAAQKAEAAAKVKPAFVLESKNQHGTIEEIEAKMTDLDTKFEDGDITLAEYNKERAGYVEAITEQKMFATINAQVQKAAAEKGWKDAQHDFFMNNSEYATERIKNVAFVDAVNRLLATDESKKMTDAQIFEAAKKECDAVFYPNGRQKADDGKDTAAEAKRKAIEAAKKAEADRAAGVKTLARVPVSEGNAGDDSRYDAIDKLTGEAYENAIAKMSGAERAQYAARS